jgi:hypothetical protein
MAPYTGDVAKVNVNELEPFKFAEEAVDNNGIWGNVKLMDNTNGTWTAKIPADIKPGTYIIRHEVSTTASNSGVYSTHVPYRSSPSTSPSEPRPALRLSPPSALSST